MKNEVSKKGIAQSADFFQSEFDRFMQICSEAPFGLAILDRDLRYVVLNEGMTAIDGRQISAHIGKTLYEVDLHIASVIEPISRYALDEGEALKDVETRVSGVNEEDDALASYWLVSSYPLQDTDGQIQGICLVIKDITAQKLREKAQEERLKFEALLSALSAEFINMDVSEVDARVVQGLKRVHEFLGYDRVTIWQFSPVDGKCHLTHSHSLQDIKQPPPVIDDIIPVWVDIARQGETFMVDDVEDLPDKFWREKKYSKDQGGIKSMFYIPLRVGAEIHGLISVVSYRQKRKWIDVFIQRFRLLGEIFANALERKRSDQKMQQAFAEIEQLRDRLQVENLFLRDQIDIELKHEEIIGESDAVKKVLLQVKQVAGTGSTVLILGETGTGKELIARAIHNQSSRRERPMVKLNCAALPATLIEAELFGREKGAYTGATTRQIGRFEAANGSTIFLDEIGELPLELQSKLLRILQEGQFERLGSNDPVTVDVRVIAATNRDLTQLVKDGRFRGDLYYRLNVFPISVPPLRERKEDIPLLIWAIVKELGQTFGKTFESIPKKNMDSLELYSWPGNIRELRNVIERAMILNNGPNLVVEVLNGSEEIAPISYSLKNVERRHILSTLDKTGWRVRGKNGAADLMGLPPSTLTSKMKKLGIKRKLS
ncbi:MAG: sigma 54-interacting transcriptional regulator [Desulfuromonadaceae bacterium]|nr:sigma 54-interacting transcriptional regulator [Desulfuromonadaceae bacterium]